MVSITSTLGAGSGIDTATLVTQLVSASFDPKLTALKTREEANVAKISTLTSLGGGIDAFATALASLVSGGTLATQPTSSDPAVLTAKARPGARLGALTAALEVRQIAQAQSLASPSLTGSGATVGQGGLTLTTPAGSYPITIDGTNDSLAGLARAINAATGSGVTASVVTGTDGARLVLKGQTGAANGFALAADSGGDPALARFTWDGAAGGMTRPQEARDAILRTDGVEVARATNMIDDLIEGVTLNLVSAKPGTTITLGSSRPTTAITQAVTDFVSAYNELKTQIDTAAASAATGTAGAFAGNAAIRDISRQLARLPSTTLNSAGGPATLAEIGVSTGRDGKLSLDTSRLTAALASDPDGVEALFNPTQHADSPLIKIASTMGAAKPGRYALADIVAAANGDPPSGTIAGVAGVAIGNSLYGSVSSPASGLVIVPQGDAASATVTVDPGIGGALKAIRDSLRATGGLLSSLGGSLTTEKRSLADARLKLETQQTGYKDRLTRSFTAMDTRVAAAKATQSYLTQQIAMWTRGN